MYEEINSFIITIICNNDSKAYYSFPTLYKKSITFRNYYNDLNENTITIPFEQADVINLLSWIDNHDYPLNIESAIVADYLDIKYGMSYGFKMLLYVNSECFSLENDPDYDLNYITPYNIYDTKSYDDIIIYMHKYIDNFISALLEYDRKDDIMINLFELNKKIYHVHDKDDLISKFNEYQKLNAKINICDPVSFTDIKLRNDKIRILLEHKLPKFMLSKEYKPDDTRIKKYVPNKISIIQYIKC